MILRWFEGPRLEMLKWWRTDKQTEFQLVDSTTPVGGVEWKKPCYSRPCVAHGNKPLPLYHRPLHELWRRPPRLRSTPPSRPALSSLGSPSSPAWWTKCCFQRKVLWQEQQNAMIGISVMHSRDLNTNLNSPAISPDLPYFKNFEHLAHLQFLECFKFAPFS